MIPAEAVEAAAWSVYNVLHPEAAATSLGQVGEPMRLVSEGIALAALEAAAPYMRADLLSALARVDAVAKELDDRASYRSGAPANKSSIAALIRSAITGQAA